MDRIDEAYKKSMAMIVFSNALDAVSTIEAINMGLYEANPIGKYLMEKLGPYAGAIVMKTGSVITLALVIHTIKELLLRMGFNEDYVSKIILLSGYTNLLINIITFINNISHIIKHTYK